MDGSSSDQPIRMMNLNPRPMGSRADQNVLNPYDKPEGAESSSSFQTDVSCILTPEPMGGGGGGTIGPSTSWDFWPILKICLGNTFLKILELSILFVADDFF